MQKAAIELNSEERRKRIIKAAIEIITEDGYPQLKLDNVVTKAGTSKSAIYSLFKNKTGLLKAIIDHAVFTVGDDIISQIIDELPVKVVLSKTLERYARRTVRVEYNAAITMIINELRESKGIGQYYLEVGPLRVVKKMQKYLEKKVASGYLDIEDCELAAQQLIGSVAWYRTTLLMYAYEVETDIDKVIKRGQIALDAFLKAYEVKQ